MCVLFMLCWQGVETDVYNGLPQGAAKQVESVTLHMFLHALHAVCDLRVLVSELQHASRSKASIFTA